MKDFDATFITGLRQRMEIASGPRAALVAKMSDVVERSCQWLGGALSHWATGEVLTEDSLRAGLVQDLRAYQERVDALARRLDAEAPELELAVARSERTLTEVSARLGAMERNLERIASFRQIGTPVGDLPIGLGQLVLLFPVALALGFALVSSGYAQMAGVRRALVRLCRKRDTQGDVMDDRHIAAIAPLWLDPQSPLSSRLALWAVLLTPFALILATLALVAFTSALTEQLPDDAAIAPSAYAALYALSVLVTLGALRQIVKAALVGAGEDAV